MSRIDFPVLTFQTGETAIAWLFGIFVLGRSGKGGGSFFLFFLFFSRSLFPVFVLFLFIMIFQEEKKKIKLRNYRGGAGSSQSPRFRDNLSR